MLIRLRMVQDSTYNFVEFGRRIEHHHISPLIFTPQMDLRHPAWESRSQAEPTAHFNCVNFTMKNTREISRVSNVWTESPWPSLRDFVNRQLIAWNELCMISPFSKNSKELEHANIPDLGELAKSCQVANIEIGIHRQGWYEARPQCSMPMFPCSLYDDTVTHSICSVSWATRSTRKPRISKASSDWCGKRGVERPALNEWGARSSHAAASLGSLLGQQTCIVNDYICFCKNCYNVAFSVSQLGVHLVRVFTQNMRRGTSNRSCNSRGTWDQKCLADVATENGLKSVQEGANQRTKTMKQPRMIEGFVCKRSEILVVIPYHITLCFG